MPFPKTICPYNPMEQSRLAVKLSFNPRHPFPLIIQPAISRASSSNRNHVHPLTGLLLFLSFSLSLSLALSTEQIFSRPLVDANSVEIKFRFNLIRQRKRQEDQPRARETRVGDTLEEGRLFFPRSRIFSSADPRVPRPPRILDSERPNATGLFPSWFLNQTEITRGELSPDARKLGPVRRKKFQSECAKSNHVRRSSGSGESRMADRLCFHLSTLHHEPSTWKQSDDDAKCLLPLEFASRSPPTFPFPRPFHESIMRVSPLHRVFSARRSTRY